jgi:putative thioredoxin
MSESAYVHDADSASFPSLVIDASRRVPVLVDFWAAWCGPCRVLAPILEGLAEEYRGRFLLVKIDTDREQELARQFGIRSLPTVKLFKDGSMVDEFMGVQPESGVRALLERYISRESDETRARAAALREQGQLAQARDLLERARTEDSENYRIVPDLVNVLIDLGELEAAAEALKSLSVNVETGDNVHKARARLAFAEAAGEAAAPEELARLSERDPRDCASRYQLGARHVVSGDYAAGMDQFIDILRIDRSFGDDAARKALLSVFEILGSDHPLVSRYRAKMSSLLH